MSVNLAVLKIAIVVRIPVPGNRKNPPILMILRTNGNQALERIGLDGVFSTLIEFDPDT